MLTMRTIFWVMIMVAVATMINALARERAKQIAVGSPEAITLQLQDSRRMAPRD